ncbi:hypothetical protein [Corallococcus carmarthensis]|uniref:Uncharacterized protein n=1 Tax=Corallococcus carmarthensis TaxID=2316728 RepID=A0A3A8KA93_9BACT|nr:hypothetical protein [Corallococcus carmarthensis]RKH05083.1 hypothetical protein D7X32_09205 [Corallococcus carmarthensis]
MKLLHDETLCAAGLLGEQLPCLTEDFARAAHWFRSNRRGARKVRRRLRELHQARHLREQRSNAPVQVKRGTR